MPSLICTPPTLTFEHRLSFHTERKAEVISLGGGHTECDAMLYLPEDKVLFIGDLVAVKSHPSLKYGNLPSWLELLDQIMEIDFDILIPGHGSIGTKENVPVIKQYLIELKEIASNLDPNASEEEIKKIQPPQPYADWEYHEIFAMNIQSLLQKA